ncbi:LytTR family transcriptional regulator DNA-binding domain-containing protein [Butyricimonas paravirosa]|uniref:LytTR family transcriptional regulator DNA-binding domain-containing protein n=1 Tax=Butyricimonas paravirosa TaxID=1472417 RepID=UPI0022E82432|nr:LytTR family transcriptional regulator DNA-binding domain-containing protein [Butyricimonas paravirosa]
MKETNDQSQRLVGDCFLYVRENVWRSVFTRKSCTWRLRGYSYIYRRDKPRLLITYPLFVVELWWPRDMFRRVHRSCIVNLRAVEGFIGKAICLADWVLPVSPLYREEVFGCFLF